MIYYERGGDLDLVADLEKKKLADYGLKDVTTEQCEKLVGGCGWVLVCVCAEV